MSDPAILSAIASHFGAIEDLPPIVWPNEEVDARAPFLIWDDGFKIGTPTTIGGGERYEYRPQVSLMVELGTYTTETDAVLWKIAQAFSFGTKITDDLGDYIAISQQTPVTSNGRPDGAYFRTDMELRIVSTT